MTTEEINEVVNAAYQVVKHPSVGAYRSQGYEKKISPRKLLRLMRALEPLMYEEAKVEISKRIEALRLANPDIDS